MTTPNPIRRFVEATNAGDTDAFLDTFTADASLTDWGRSFHGREQIARWNQSDNIGVKSQLRIVHITSAEGRYRVRIAVTGNGFNGEGDMSFTLDGDRIAVSSSPDYPSWHTGRALASCSEAAPRRPRKTTMAVMTVIAANTISSLSNAVS